MRSLGLACMHSVQFSCSVVFDSLQPHELQHARLPCPSPTAGVYPKPCPLSWWCHPTISSSVIPFSSCPQSFPASGSFQMSQLFASGGQIIGASASTSVLPVNTQDWSPLGWTGWISLQFKGLSKVFSNTTVQKHLIFTLYVIKRYWFVSVTFKWKMHSYSQAVQKQATSHWSTLMDLYPSARSCHHQTLTLSISGRWPESRMPLHPWGSRHDANREWRKNRLEMPQINLAHFIVFRRQMA